MKYPLASSSWDEKEINALNEVIASSNFTMGEKTSLFEKKIAKYLGVKFCVMVNSGSSANLLAVAALFYTKENPLKRGDEVIVPAVSWATTYSPLYQYGLKLKFVDVDMKTFNIDLSSLQEAISPKTKAVFAVNILGNPNEFNELESICKKHGLMLLEDNCESLGAKYRGQYTGTFGKVATFSSFFSHHISTMEGGFIATNDEEIYHILLSIRSHGWTRHLFSKDMASSKKPYPFEESFKFILPGYNVRPTELTAVLGIEQLKKLPGIVKMRRNNAHFFYQMMEKFQDIFLFQEEVGESSFFGFSLILKKEVGKSRKDIINHLIRNGIEVRPIIAGNFTMHPTIKYFDYSIHGKLTNAQTIHDLGFFIGNHHYNLKAELTYFVQILEEVVSDF